MASLWSHVTPLRFWSEMNILLENFFSARKLSQLKLRELQLESFFVLELFQIRSTTVRFVNTPAPFHILSRRGHSGVNLYRDRWRQQNQTIPRDKLAIIFNGWLINITHTAGWVRPDSRNYRNLKFNILLLFILFRIVFSWIFLIICTFQILLI